MDDIAAARSEDRAPAASSRRSRRPDRRARRQRSVKVWLSAGQRSATVPLLVGETERTAQLRLAQDGLTLSDVSEIRSQRLPARRRRRADAAGEERRRPSVALLVNRGERGASYVMPDLIGVNGDRAAEILRSRGFRVAVVGSNPYPGVAAGIVHPPESAGRISDRRRASRSRSR